MKRLLILGLLLIGQPAIAEEYLLFHGGDHKQVDMIITDNPNVQPTDVLVPFVATNNDRVAQNYDYTLDQNSNPVLVYSPPPPPPTPVVPDVASFVVAIRTEPTFDAATRLAIASNLLALFQMDMANPPALQQDWADAKTAYGSTWLTAAVQQKIEGFATTYNIPLVAQ